MILSYDQGPWHHVMKCALLEKATIKVTKVTTVHAVSKQGSTTTQVENVELFRSVHFSGNISTNELAVILGAMKSHAWCSVHVTVNQLVFG